MPSEASPPSNPAPTDSEIYIQDFLAKHPELDADLGDVHVMTDRYTNQEWAEQIRETQRQVLEEVEERGKEGGKGWKYDVPGVEDGGLAKTVDHTLLKLDATQAAIDALCSEARVEGFKSVCVRLPWVPRCISNLKGTDVLVACVVGFHEGTHDTYSKLREARAAVAAGAAELDIVLNHRILTAANPRSPSAAAKRSSPVSRDSTADTITAANTAANSPPQAGTHATQGPYSVPGTAPNADSAEPAHIPDYAAIFKELASLRALCPPPTVLKLILETSQLTDAQILAAAHLAAAANIDFIKTSTGFAGGGATLPHVRLMVSAAEYLSVRTARNKGRVVKGDGKAMRVKASGGIRDVSAAREMLGAGAQRLGTSSGVWIVKGAREEAGRGEGKGEQRPGGLETRLYTDESVGGGY